MAGFLHALKWTDPNPDDSQSCECGESDGDGVRVGGAEGSQPHVKLILCAVDSIKKVGHHSWVVMAIWEVTEVRRICLDL